MTVVELGLTQQYPKEAELSNRLMEVIYEYAGEVSTPAVIGCLDIVKSTLYMDQFVTRDEE